MTNQYPTAQFDSGKSIEERVRLLQQVVNGLMDGKHNATGTVTFTANASSTVINDRRIGANSIISLHPTTESAAGEVGYWVSSVGQFTATISHASDSRSDRTFRYVIDG